MDEHTKQVRDAFLKSRDGAIVRCASIVLALKRKDLAKQILDATGIDREKFEALKAQNK